MTGMVVVGGQTAPAESPAAEADIDLVAFAAAGDLERRTKLWQREGRVLAEGDMPPRDSAQPTAEERESLLGFVQESLAAVGAKTARPDLKVIAMVGDGAFQMTGVELSTIVCRGLAVTVIVLDTKGYGTDRLLLEGSLNDINPWQYHRIPEVLAGGTGWDVRTEGEFDTALTAALANERTMNLIRVEIPLNRLAAGLAKRVKHAPTKPGA